jgi:hypothetical protein
MLSSRWLFFYSAVMAGLVAAIYASPRWNEVVDARDKPGHDEHN